MSGCCRFRGRAGQCLLPLKGSQFDNARLLQIQRESLVHMPDAEGWERMMQPVHDSLSESAGGRAAPQLGRVNLAMALQEYESNGQGGLDALLEALDSSSDVRLPLAKA